MRDTADACLASLTLAPLTLLVCVRFFLLLSVNESAHIQNALLILLFFGVLIVPLDLMIQSNPSAAMLIQGVGQSLLCLLLTLTIFAPKVYAIVTRAGDAVIGVGTDNTQVGKSQLDDPNASVMKSQSSPEHTTAAWSPTTRPARPLASPNQPTRSAYIVQ